LVVSIIFFQLKREEKIASIKGHNKNLVCGEDEVIDMDGNRYKTMQIDFQCWMAENMKSGFDANGGKVKVFCYDDDPANCDLYGGLYHAEDARRICPQGWRLPWDDDFKDLEKILGINTPEVDSNGWRGEGIGRAIKDKSWGEGVFEFNVLPAGFMNSTGEFKGLNDQACLWGVAFNLEKSWMRALDRKDDRIFRGAVDNENGFSVRCLKN